MMCSQGASMRQIYTTLALASFLTACDLSAVGTVQPGALTSPGATVSGETTWTCDGSTGLKYRAVLMASGNVFVTGTLHIALTPVMYAIGDSSTEAQTMAIGYATVGTLSIDDQDRLLVRCDRLTNSYPACTAQATYTIPCTKVEY